VLNKTYSVVVSTFAKNSSGSLALSVPYVSKVVVKENSSTSGTLVPGGSFTSRDGVVVSAPAGVISTPIQVFAEKVNSTAIAVPFPPEYSPVGDFYRVGATERVSSNNFFRIKLPIPQGEVAGNLGVMILLPAGALTDTDLPDNQLIWYYTSTDGIEEGRALIEDSVLEKTGLIYVLTRYKNISGSSSKSLNAAEALPYKFECSLGRVCPSDLETTAKSASLGHYNDFIRIMGLGADNTKPILKKILLSSCASPNGSYRASTETITICITASNNTPEGNVSNTLRHEIFHSVQAIWYDAKRNDLRVLRRWIIEATATAAEYSDETQMTRDTSKLIRKVTTVLDSDVSQDPYRAQDFWIYFGKSKNQGLPILKNLFKTGLNSPKADADNYFAGIDSTQRLPQNYWKWSKNQGYEKTIDLWNQGNACRPDNNAINPDYTGQTLRLEATATSVSTSSPINVGSLQTRVIPIRFTNTDSRSVKVTLEATTPTATPLNYKIYEGTVPTSQTDCTNDPEGTFQNGTKAEILETVSNKTELVVFVANTDFATASSFTVTVEPVVLTTAPKIKQQTPNGLQDLMDDRVLLEGTEGKAVSATLVLTNEGDLSSIMDYTAYPIGQYVYSDSVSSAGFSKKVKSKRRIVTAGIRYPTVAGSASNEIYSSNLSSPKVGQLRHISNLEAPGVPDKLEIPVSAKCGTRSERIYYYDAFYWEDSTLQIVYSTGLTDDYGTPNDPSDDKPELEVLVIPISLSCSIGPSPVAGISIGRDVIAVREKSHSVPVTISNSGNATMQFNAIVRGSSYSGTLEPGETLDFGISGLTCVTDDGQSYSLRVPYTLTSNDAIHPLLSDEWRLQCLENQPVLSVNKTYFDLFGVNRRAYEVRNYGGVDSTYEFIAPITAAIKDDGIVIGTATIRPFGYFESEFVNDGLYWKRRGTLSAGYGDSEYHFYLLAIDCPVAGNVEYVVEVRDVADSRISRTYRQYTYCSR
jgi:hypothetical protein